MQFIKEYDNKWNYYLDSSVKLDKIKTLKEFSFLTNGSSEVFTGLRVTNNSRNCINYVLNTFNASIAGLVDFEIHHLKHIELGKFDILFITSKDSDDVLILDNRMGIAILGYRHCLITDEAYGHFIKNLDI